MEALAARQLERRQEKEKAEKLKVVQEAESEETKAQDTEQQRAINRIFGLPEPPVECFTIGRDKSAAVWWPEIQASFRPTLQKKEESEETMAARAKRKLQAKTRAKLGYSQTANNSSSNNNAAQGEEDEVGEDDFCVDDDEDLTLYDVIGFEIHRYRKDNGQWNFKGFTSLIFEHVPTGEVDEESGVEKYRVVATNQIVIENLSNDHEYRFTVKGVNKKGVGIESPPSNPVYVEKALPPGWFRFYDEKRQRYYYANLKLKRSRWTRPESDPYYLDESIVDNFEEREIKFLQELFYEEMQHFGCVTIERFVSMLHDEVGERLTIRNVTNLFRGYIKKGDKTKVSSWTYFMEIISHIKRKRINSDMLLQKPIENFTTWTAQVRASTFLSANRDKMGEWEEQYSKLAERHFYKNSVTGEMCWSMPPAVKFFVPPKLMNKLLVAFDYGQINDFQTQFALLDIDSSGDLSRKEILLLLEAMNIEVSEQLFNKLINTIDLNGNGTIEFDEFCYMMYQIYRKDTDSDMWQEMKTKNHVGSMGRRKTPYPVLHNDDDSTIITTAGPAFSSLLDEENSVNLLSGPSNWSGKRREAEGELRQGKERALSRSWTADFRLEKMQSAINALGVSAHQRHLEQQQQALYSRSERRQHADEARAAEEPPSVVVLKKNCCSRLFSCSFYCCRCCSCCRGIPSQVAVQPNSSVPPLLSSRSSRSMTFDPSEGDDLSVFTVDTSEMAAESFQRQASSKMSTSSENQSSKSEKSFVRDVGFETEDSYKAKDEDEVISVLDRVGVALKELSIYIGLSKRIEKKGPKPHSKFCFCGCRG